MRCLLDSPWLLIFCFSPQRGLDRDGFLKMILLWSNHGLLLMDILIVCSGLKCIVFFGIFAEKTLIDGLFHEYKKWGRIEGVRVISSPNSSSERYAVVSFKKWVYFFLNFDHTSYFHPNRMKCIFVFRPWCTILWFFFFCCWAKPWKSILNCTSTFLDSKRKF